MLNYMFYMTLVLSCGLVCCENDTEDSYYFDDDMFSNNDGSELYEEKLKNNYDGNYNYGDYEPYYDTSNLTEVYDTETIDADLEYENRFYSKSLQPQNSILYQIEPYRSSLNKLYNSSETANERIFNLLRKESYWNLQRVEYGLNLTIGPAGGISHLNASEVKEVKIVSQLVRNKMVEIFEENPKQWLIQSMHKQRHHLASAYSHETIFSHFHDVMESVEKGDWKCINGSMVNIWKILIDDGKTIERPTHAEAHDEEVVFGSERFEVFYALVNLAEAFFKVTEEGKMQENANILTMKADLINTLSKKVHLPSLGRLVGSHNVDAWIEMILCEKLSLETLEYILQEISLFIASADIEPEDISCIMNIQEKICQITSKLNYKERAIDSVKGSSGIVLNMLDVYMSVVDKSVDNNAVDAWGQLSNHAIKKNLHDILHNTEQYVGVVSDAMYLRDKDNIEIEKSILSLKISEIHEVFTRNK